ncbi:FxSxx-COOH system tetratricopeptide repeat protein [Pseudofrankia saprophytica]|uniref:FxSxx-COOH system tetratricopeptide repeat protein n=1 Tax=Pseudofrankia saprophytica TaxID=298655 RepID=UPI000234C71A|nr:FxSxx-COOH system tetratricopeptide repeat protein [Pseudofrankia saprophytica]
MTGGSAVDAQQRFFVSYTGVDVRWAEWVAWTFEAVGHEALIQAWDFGPGSHFVSEMQRSLSGGRRTVAVLSEAYLRSAFASEEWQAVWAADPDGAKRLLLVVRVEECARPGLLRQIVSVDLFGVDEQAARTRLLDAVALRRRKPAVAPRFPVSVDAGVTSVGVAVGGSAGAAPVFPMDLPGVWNVPPRLARFVGREALLAGMAEDLAAQGLTSVCAVQGAGGTGKTALAVEYAHRHKDEFEVVWWVPAQDADLVAGHIGALGVAIGLAEGADWPTVAAELRHQGHRWLLVLDNVDAWDLVTPFRPSDPRGRLLVTSRLAGLDGAGGAVEVGEFTSREAVALLAERVRGIDLEVAGRVVAVLGLLPLAVEQAAGYLRQTGMPPAEYATLVESRLGDMLGRGRVADRPGVTVANLWALSMARLRAEPPAAGALLELCAFCGPEPIPLDLVAGGSAELAEGPLRAAAGDPLAWADAVGALVGYSLARRDGSVLTVHRLIAAATRAEMTSEDRLATEACLVRLLAATVPADVRDPAGWPRWRDLLPHVRAVLDADENERDGETIRALSWLCGQTGLYLAHHGRPDAAIPYIARSLALNRTHLGVDHSNTIESRNYLAYVYQAAGRLEEAIDLYEQTLADSEQVLSADHPSILTARNNLAGAYQAAGRLEQAIPLHQKAVADMERVLGADDSNTVLARNNLAHTYHAAGRLEEAIDLYEQTLADSEQVLSADHPSILTARNNLAGAYQAAGRLEQAIPLHQKTVADMERVLGADHPSTLSARNNVAGAHLAAGQSERAIQLYKATLADRERVLGADHLDTLISRSNLAFAYRAAGRLEQAIPLHKEAVADMERVLGPDHLETLGARNNLAYAYQTAGRLEQAIPLHQKTLADMERVLGADHPSTLSARNNLAGAHQAAGQSERAIQLYKATLADRERILGGDHPSTMISRNNVAGSYQAAGRLDQAIQLYKENLAAAERVLDLGHPMLDTFRANLAAARRVRPSGFLRRR